MPFQPASTESTKAALTGLLAAFKSGDREKLIACYADDVDWLFLAPASVFPFAGPRHGKAEVRKGFSVLFENYRIISYQTQAVLADGEWASTLADGQFLQKDTGRTIRIRTGNFYRFGNGLVIQYRGFTDSLDIVEQVIGRELDF